MFDVQKLKGFKIKYYHLLTKRGRYLLKKSSQIFFKSYCWESSVIFYQLPVKKNRDQWITVTLTIALHMKKNVRLTQQCTQRIWK